MHDDHDVKQRARPSCTAVTIVDLFKLIDTDRDQAEGALPDTSAELVSCSKPIRLHTQVGGSVAALRVPLAARESIASLIAWLAWPRAYTAIHSWSPCYAPAR